MIEDLLRQIVREELATQLANLPLPLSPAPCEQDDQVLDAQGLMDYLGVGRNTAYGLLNAAPFPVRRIGTLLLCHKSVVRRWLCEAQEKPAALRLTNHSALPREKRA